MPESQDLGEFKREVEMALEDLLQMDLPNWISPHRGAPELYDDVQAYGIMEYAIPKLSRFKWFARRFKDRQPSDAEIKDEIEENARKAEEILQQKSFVKDHLCPVLKSATDDVFVIANTILPILFTVGIIQVNPLIVALAALMIGRIGIKNLCNANDTSVPK